VQAWENLPVNSEWILIEGRDEPVRISFDKDVQIHHNHRASSEG
jgi:hypothetical protein